MGKSSCVFMGPRAKQLAKDYKIPESFLETILYRFLASLADSLQAENNKLLLPFLEKSLGIHLSYANFSDTAMKDYYSKLREIYNKKKHIFNSEKEALAALKNSEYIRIFGRQNLSVYKNKKGKYILNIAPIVNFSTDNMLYSELKEDALVQSILPLFRHLSKAPHIISEESTVEDLVDTYNVSPELAHTVINNRNRKNPFFVTDNTIFIYKGNLDVNTKLSDLSSLLVEYLKENSIIVSELNTLKKTNALLSNIENIIHEKEGKVSNEILLNTLLNNPSFLESLLENKEDKAEVKEIQEFLNNAVKELLKLPFVKNKNIFSKNTLQENTLLDLVDSFNLGKLPEGYSLLSFYHNGSPFTANDTVYYCTYGNTIISTVNVETLENVEKCNDALKKGQQEVTLTLSGKKVTLSLSDILGEHYIPEVKRSLLNTLNSLEDTDKAGEAKLLEIEIRKEMEEIKEKAISDGRIILNSDGTFKHALAPNDNISNLNLELWLYVRTKAFKEWFGDWSKIIQNEDGTWNIPDDVSKVINLKTGEPLVVYHRSNASGFNTFNLDKSTKTREQLFSYAYHAGTKEAAEGVYTYRSKNASMFELFFNLKNPIELTDSTQSQAIRTLVNFAGLFAERNYGKKLPEELYKKYRDKVSIDNSPEEIRATMEKVFNYMGFDGYYYINEVEDAGSTSWAVLNSNQIKSATLNLGTYLNETGRIDYSTDSENTTTNNPLTQELISKITQAGIPVVLATEENLREIIRNNRGKTLSLPDGTIYGFTMNDKIYLNENRLNPNTAIHEYTHLWCEAIKASDPKLWGRIKYIILQDSSLLALRASILSDGDYAYLKNNEDALVGEVLSRLSGNKNRAKLEALESQLKDKRGIFNRILNAIKHFWKYISRTFFNTRDINTIEDITDTVLKDLLEGKELSRGEELNFSSIYGENNSSLNYFKDSQLEALFNSGKIGIDGTVETSIVNIINRIEDSQYSTIVELLKAKFGNREEKLLKDIKVKLVSSSVGFRSKWLKNSRAFYNASTKTIYINVGAHYNEGNSSAVLLHEVMHAITVDKILSNPEAKTKFEQILKDYQNTNFDPRYAEWNDSPIEEFTANIWSDPETIENLKKIKSTRVKQSLWEEIKEFFNNLFSGIFKGTTSDSLMAEASIELIKLLESPTTVQSGKTFRENLSMYKKETFYSKEEAYQFIKNLKEYEGYTDNNIKIQYFKGTEDLDDYWEVTYSKLNATTVEYTPEGEEKQTFLIVNNKVYNNKWKEVTKNVDRNKIFAKLAIKQGRAVVVEHSNGKKYVVNDKNVIMSVTTGEIMQWGEENGDRKNILALAQTEFNKKNNTALPSELEQLQWVEQNKKQLIDSYIEKHGNLYDPDEVRKLFEPLGYNQENLSTFYNAGRQLSNYIKQALFENLSKSNNKTVVILTGTPGSGKSHATENKKEEFSKKGLVLDSAFHTVHDLQQVVEEARKAGVKDEDILIIAIYNDVITTYKNSIERGKKTKRWLPLDYFIKSFLKNLDKIQTFVRNNPNIKILTIDNSNNLRRECTIEEAYSWDYDVTLEDYINLINLIQNDGNITREQQLKLSGRTSSISDLRRNDVGSREGQTPDGGRTRSEVSNLEQRLGLIKKEAFIESSDLNEEELELLKKLEGFITWTTEEAKPCASRGLVADYPSTEWKVVKDFNGYPKHSAGGVDIEITKGGVFMVSTEGKRRLCEDGLFIPNSRYKSMIKSSKTANSLRKFDETKYPEVTVIDEPWADNYFKNNPIVAGMAIGKGLNGIEGTRRVIINPYSEGINKEAVLKNERLRHYFDEIDFKLNNVSKAQMDKYKGTSYEGDTLNIGRTEAARYLTGDKHLLSEEQKAVVDKAVMDNIYSGETNMYAEGGLLSNISNFIYSDGRVLGLNGKQWLEVGIGISPFAGSFIEFGKLVYEPSWKLAGALGFSLITEIPFFKIAKLGKIAKAVKAADEATDAIATYNKLQRKADRMREIPNIKPSRIRTAERNAGAANINMATAVDEAEQAAKAAKYFELTPMLGIAVGAVQDYSQGIYSNYFEEANKYADGGSLSKWKALQNIDFEAIPDTTFTRDKTGTGSIEYFQAKYPQGITYPNGYHKKHPKPGKDVILYNPNENDEQDIRLDALHIMPKDATYDVLNTLYRNAAMGTDVERNAKQRYEEDVRKYGATNIDPYENYFNNEADGLLRNMLIEGTPEYIKGKRYYPDKEQLAKWNKPLLGHINEIRKYLETGKRPPYILPEVVTTPKK